MRTKTLLCLAALAAGAATSMAQSNVYSLNVVGYINVTVPANGFALIANQLNTTNNNISALIPNAPDGAQFYKYTTGTGYKTYTYDALIPGWDSDTTLSPGEGGFFKNNTASPLTLTFVGEVMQGTTTNALPTGYSIRSSIVPQAGTLADLGFPGEDGDQVFTFVNGSGYKTATFDALIPGWDTADPKGPSIAVGESFFVKKATTSTTNAWIRNFTVQ
jgi:hypothetical protein